MTASSRAYPLPTRTRLLVTLAAVALILASGFASIANLNRVSAQGTNHALADAVPAGTVMYNEVDLNQDSDQWVKTYELIDRSGLNQVAEQETGSTVDEIGESAEQLSITGTAAMVFTDAESLVSYSSADISASTMDMTSDLEAAQLPDVPEGLVILIAPDDPDAIAQQFVDLVNNEADNAGVDVQAIEYNGVTITYVEHDDVNGTGTATAAVDDIVMLSPRVADLEPIIDTIQGTTPSLASEDGFSAVADKLGSDNLIFGYMNLDAMVAAALADPSFADLVDMADIDAMTGHLGYTIYASDAGFHFDSVFIPNYASLLNASEGFTPSMASAFPADVMTFANANDLYSSGISDMLAGFLGGIVMGMTTYDESTPVAMPTTEEIWASMESMLGFNPDTDLLQKLDGEWAVSVSIPDLDPATFEVSPEVLFVSETSDPATLEQTTATITGLLTQMNAEGSYTLSERAVEGGTLQVITIDAEYSSGIPVVIEYGVIDSELIISVNGAVDRYLSDDEPKLADDANFTAVLDALPSDNVVSVSYLNIEGQVMPLLDVMVMQLSASFNTLDNDESCGEFATQDEAQVFYDEDPFTNWLLDLDYDGTACEDYFAESMAPESTPESVGDMVHIPAAGTVTWVDGDTMWVSGVLLIGE